MHENGDMDIGQRVSSLEREVGIMAAQSSATIKAVDRLVEKIEQVLEERGEIRILKEAVTRHGLHLASVSDKVVVLERSAEKYVGLPERIADIEVLVEQGRGAQRAVNFGIGGVGILSGIYAWLKTH